MITNQNGYMLAIGLLDLLNHIHQNAMEDIRNANVTLNPIDIFIGLEGKRKKKA